MQRAQFKAGRSVTAAKASAAAAPFPESSSASWPHICAFFGSEEEELRILLPFVREGLECGHKVVHTVDPAAPERYVRHLAEAGIPVGPARANGQLEIRTWAQTHLQGGRFDQERTLAHFGDLARDARQQGFDRVRFLTHMEWALARGPGADALLEYEARANLARRAMADHDNPVICAYDLRRFSADVVVDVMRTHPMTIVNGILQENPFFVPPDEFLRQLRGRRASRGG